MAKLRNKKYCVVGTRKLGTLGYGSHSDEITAKSWDIAVQKARDLGFRDFDVKLKKRKRC